MTSATIIVETAQQSYPVHIFSDMASCEFTSLFVAKQIVVVTQAKILALHPHFLSHLLSSVDFQTILLPDGEQHKNIETWQWLLGELVRLKCQRTTVLIAWGGGVVGDIVGFAASTFYRGIPFVQIPTTLIAQVDSAVGGKTGVNLGSIKNAVGAFYQPQVVLSDVRFLASLPEREFIAGLAEVIKYGLIADANFFAWLEDNMAAILHRNEAALLYMVEQCVRLKAAIVGADEREQNGLRQLLNFGHTFGHALESYFNYQVLLHGEAVAIGMWLAATLSFEISELDRDSLLRIQAILHRSRLISRHFIIPKASAWINIMASDKKNLNACYRFILLKRIGLAVAIDIASLNTVESLIDHFNASPE